MKIVIIGDGKVGYKLARQLSADDYDIVMIDSNERKLRFAIDRLDIFCVHGNGVDARPQLKWLRGRDLNPRPSDYEPDELPTAPPRDGHCLWNSRSTMQEL